LFVVVAAAAAAAVAAAAAAAIVVVVVKFISLLFFPCFLQLCNLSQSTNHIFTASCQTQSINQSYLYCLVSSKIYIYME